MPQEIDRFWMVYGLRQGAPTVRHKTASSAETEARRLARGNPGVKFFVLEAVAVAEKVDVEFTRLPEPARPAWPAQDEAEIPF